MDSPLLALLSILILALRVLGQHAGVVRLLGLFQDELGILAVALLLARVRAVGSVGVSLAAPGAPVVQGKRSAAKLARCVTA